MCFCHTLKQVPICLSCFKSAWSSRNVFPGPGHFTLLFICTMVSRWQRFYFLMKRTFKYVHMCSLLVNFITYLYIFLRISCQHVCVCVHLRQDEWVCSREHIRHELVCARVIFCHRNVPLSCNKVNVSVFQSMCHHLTAGWRCFLCVEDFIVSAAGCRRLLIVRVCVCNGVIGNKELESPPLLENYLWAQCDARDFFVLLPFQREKIHFRVERFHFPTSRLSRWHLILAVMC